MSDQKHAYSQDSLKWEVAGHCVRTRASRNERGGMSGGHLIAECSIHWTPDVVRANALLIAAAPDLLAALSECVTACDFAARGHFGIAQRAEAAIAKATESQQDTPT